MGLKYAHIWNDKTAAYKAGYDMAIEKLRSEVERAVGSNCEIMAAYYTEAADGLDANRPKEAK